MTNSPLANLPGVSGAVAPRSLIVRGGVYAAGGAFFAAGSLSTRAKKASLQICRPEIRRISGKSEEDVLKGDLSPFKRAKPATNQNLHATEQLLFESYCNLY